MSRGTKQTQVRLSEADKAKLDAIQARYKLPTRSDAIREAIGRLYVGGIPATPAPKKSRKNSVKGA